MKKIAFTLFLSLAWHISFSQNQQVVDSLKHELAIVKQDTSRALILINLCEFYRFSKPDSAMQYIEPALALAQQIKFHRGEALALGSMAGVLRDAGNFSQSLEIGFKGLKIADSYGCLTEKGYCLLENGSGYEWSNDYLTAISHYQQAKRIFEELPPNNKRTNRRLLIIYVGLARAFNDLNQLDSASHYEQKAYDKYLQFQKNKNIEAKERFLAVLLQEQGNTEARKGHYTLALDYYQQGIKVADKVNEYRDKSFLYVQIAKLYKQTNQLDSCIYYAKKGLIEAQKGPFRKTIIDNSALLAEAYQLKNDYKQAFNYQELILASNTNLYGIKNIHTIQKMISDEEENRQKAEVNNIAFRNRIKLYVLLAGLGIALIIAYILYRNNKHKQEANTILEKTLTELKSTQAQLIQKEKLASLGELTAGIAHEIQNPLNFVNNFSELSVDLVKDLKEEIEKPDIDKEYVGELFTDLSQNQEKINHHGKRASSIVKGMLEHSRASTGVKELTDINKLADEYLRLSYHGLRAKDKDFNADFTTDFDENMPKIEVIPQDIGRVLLNLINNAFYAVHERNLRGFQNLEGFKDYTPSVYLTTKHVDNQIIISVKDNGLGMSEAVKAKVFQPFFTTKPTGEGTGLGLSLAYDIVVKGHGGTLEVKSAENHGTTFIVKLPLKMT